MGWDFQVVQVTAQGTFGTVCVAFDWSSRRFYALKVLKDRFKHNRKVLTRTHDEATMLAKMRHPNILEVKTMIEVQSRPIVVMEWIQGCSLQDLIECHPIGIDGPIALDLLRQAAAALDAAYNTETRPGGKPMHVIHRDIKPSNLVLSVEGVVKVVDFGIARADFEEKQSNTVSMVLGARAYMAPERLDGGYESPLLDVYALGLVLIELLRGHRLKLSMRPNVHGRQKADALDALEIGDVSETGADAIKELADAMTAYDPDERPYAAEVVERIEAILDDEGDEPDMRGFANEYVRPIFEANSLVDPRSTEHYRHLAFLDAVGPTEPGGADDIDEQLEDFLAHPQWSKRVEELWTLLLLNPAWTVEPFLNWLDDRKTQWWKFWQPNTATVQQKIALIRILGCRFDNRVERRMQRFKHDPHPRVRELADALLTAQEITGL